MDRLWSGAASSGLDDRLVIVSRSRAQKLPGRLHPLFDPCDQALLDVEVFVPLLPEPRQVRAMPHCDRELREIGDLLPQIRELLVHVTSLHALLARNDPRGWPTRCKQMA
jgi:hypothetical protein